MRKPSKVMLPSQEEIVKKLIGAAKENLDIAKQWAEMKANYSHSRELLAAIDLSIAPLMAAILYHKKLTEDVAELRVKVENSEGLEKHLLERRTWVVGGYQRAAYSNIHDIIYQARKESAKRKFIEATFTSEDKEPAKQDKIFQAYVNVKAKLPMSPDDWKKIANLKKRISEAFISKEAIADLIYGDQPYDKKFYRYLLTLEHTAESIEAKKTDLSDSVFYGMQQPKADLPDRSFKSSDLTRANFKGAGLHKADLRYATLYDTDLRDANLDGAKWTGVKLCVVKRKLVDAQYHAHTVNYSDTHMHTVTHSLLEFRHAARLDYKKHGSQILRQNFVDFKELSNFDHENEPLQPKSAEAYLQGLVGLIHGKSNGEAINAKLLKDILSDIGKVTLNDVADLKHIQSKADLLKFKKAYAKLAVEYLLPYITDIKELVKLVDVFEAYYDKPSDYRYLRRESNWWRAGKYGNTNTWFDVAGDIKLQLKAAYAKEMETAAKDVDVTQLDWYQDFYDMMNTHRMRTLAPCRDTGSASLFAKPSQKKEPVTVVDESVSDAQGLAK